MLADVSHELKTPLTAMRGYVETLHDVGARRSTRRHASDTSRRSSGETLRLDRIVKDLLDLARLENGVGTLDRRRVRDRTRCSTTSSGGTSATRAARRIAGDAGRRSTPISVRRSRSARTGHRESRRQRTAPYADGGRVDCPRPRSGDVVLSVTDSGTGFRRNTCRTSSSASTRSTPPGPRRGGSGLGLSIAKAIVERHGGTIRVTSVPGRTVFAVALPQEAMRSIVSRRVGELVADAPRGEDERRILGVLLDFRRSQLTTVSTVRPVT